MSDSRSVPRASVMGTIGRALLWGFLGAVVAPVAALAVGIVAYRLSPQCGRAWDSGGCEMGIFVMMAVAAPVGAGLFFVVTLVRRLL